MSTPHATLDLPEEFLLGAATAAYQIEGAADRDGRGPSIWDTFSHKPGTTTNGDTGDVACAHYDRLEQDLDLMAELGLDSYRFSISWSRVIPTGRGAVNEAGLAFYERLVDGLRQRGIAPLVTLYHWDLPQPLEDEGGWTSRQTATAFAEYAAVVADRLGDRVHTWLTLNEPFCAAFLGYFTGEHAPGRTDPASALAAAHHLNLAHGLAVAELRKRVSGQIGVALNLQMLRPQGATGVEAVRQVQLVTNEIFLGPLLDGAYPTELTERTASITDWSFVMDGDEALIHQPINVLGINYYSTLGAHLAEDADRPGVPADIVAPGLPDVRISRLAGPYTEMGWNVDPDALEQLLRDVHERYPRLPLMITENGFAQTETVRHENTERVVSDPARIDYLRAHLAVVARLLVEGVQITGFQVWSLMDNFEWAHGYTKPFGLIHVDFNTLERTPKASARWYRNLARTRRLA